MKRFAIVVTLVVATMAAAGCESSSTPTSPTTSGPDAPGFTVSGIVTEPTANGLVPVGGAFVEETRTKRGAITDQEGLYRISGVTAGVGAVRVVKEGYVASPTNVDIRTDTRVDVSVTRIANHVISGVVFERTPAGRVAVEDVHLYCDSCGSPEGHTFTASDGQGRYAFAWAMNGVHPIQVWKQGYALAHPDGTYGGLAEYVTATVSSDTQLDIEVVRR